MQPVHFAAMCVWQGAAEFYRDMGHHGGIACRFVETWYREAIGHLARWSASPSADIVGRG